MKWKLALPALIGLACATAMGSNPCPANGKSMGTAIQRKCESGVPNCSFLLPNYTSDRVCNVWCCYDYSGAPMGYLLEGCSAWAPNGCCSDLNPGWLPNGAPICDDPL